jgi:putative acetyltransferase
MVPRPDGGWQGDRVSSLASELTIRAERSSDHPRVQRIQEEAFGQPDEAELVRVLRSVARPQLSLVAELAGACVGHVFFSPVAIEGSGARPPAAGLAPLAVLPEFQGRGVGSRLVRAGLEACVPLGWQAVFLVGAPAYYARFGFALAAPRGLQYESPAFDSAFQFIELRDGALAGCEGWIRYHEAFARV